MREPVFIPQEALAQSRAAALRLREALKGRLLRYYIESYGCQMNDHDSEKLAGMLCEAGFQPAPSKEAADFILSDPDAVPHLSIKQIAARAGVSMPTVTRLVRRAGYSGFTELRIALAGSFTKNKPVASGDDDGEFFSKLMLGQMRSVEAALKAADEERICALAKRLVTSTGCVLLCGAGAAAGIAESAGSALVELGIRAVCPQKPETRAAYSALLGEGDTLFCIRSEGSRESAQQLTECIRTAKKGGAYTVFVCNEPCISAESEADCSICTTCESDIRRLLGYATSASLVAFTEALLALTARYAGKIPENAYRGRMQ